MNPISQDMFNCIQESIHDPYMRTCPFTAEEKIEILNDLIAELKAEKSFIESIERIEKQVAAQ